MGTIIKLNGLHNMPIRSLNAAIGVVAPSALKFASDTPKLCEPITHTNSTYYGSDGELSPRDCLTCAKALVNYANHEENGADLSTEVKPGVPINDATVVVCDFPETVTENLDSPQKGLKTYTIGQGKCYMVKDELLGRYQDFPWFCKQWKPEGGAEYPCSSTQLNGKELGCTGNNIDEGIPKTCQANGSNSNIVDSNCIGPSDKSSGCELSMVSYDYGFEWPCWERKDNSIHLMCGSQDAYGYPCQYTISKCVDKNFMSGESHLFGPWCDDARNWCQTPTHKFRKGLEDKKVEAMCDAAGFQFVA